MNLSKTTVLGELSAKVIRGWAILLFLVISGSLWIGFACDTFFATDGSFYFTIILDKARFTQIAPARAHAEWMTQWPLVLGVKSGITDLGMLEVLFGLGIWFPWVLSFAISLYATRERPALIFVMLISFVSLNLAAWALVYGEHMVLLSVAWPILFLAILRRPLNVLEQVLLLFLLVVHLKLYETTVISGAFFTVIFSFRVWLVRGWRERGINTLFLGLAIASVAIALTWILYPRDADNRSGFLGAILGSLAHPYPWIGMSFVGFSAAGLLLQSKKLLKLAWLVPLVIGLISLPVWGVNAGVSFFTRTLTLTALPLLLMTALVMSFLEIRVNRHWLMMIASLVVGVSLLHVRHLQGWLGFRSDFKEILESEEGLVNPADHDDIVHWGWTNTVLSYVWSEGEVQSVILNPESTTWNPFDPETEVLMSKYLKSQPTFVKEK